MTQIIYKYQLKVQLFQTIEVPQGGEILMFREQHNRPTMWIRHDKGSPIKKQEFMLVSTGDEFIPDNANGSTLDYVGSCLLDNGATGVNLFMIQLPIQDMFRDMLIGKLQQLREERIARGEEKEEL